MSQEQKHFDLDGKKILFIGIGFYDYEQAIRSEIEKMGALVYCISSCEISSTSRLLNFWGLKKIAHKLNNRARYNLLKNTADGYDIIFAIKGDNLNQADLNLLKKKNPNAQWKLYLWDSMIRHSNLKVLFEYFDNVWSFDRVDCTKNSKLKFRPLFYRDRNLESISDRPYTLSFIGWMHSDRLVLARQIRDELLERGDTYFIKLFITPFRYFVARYITRTISEKDKELLITKTINYERYLEVTRGSKIVLDIAHPLQSGLTMRSIEALSEGCHLITTSYDIRNYEDIPSYKYTIMQRCIENKLIPTLCDNNNIDMKKYSIKWFINDLFATP